MEPLWFPRFAAIPGVSYESPTGLRAPLLPGHGQKPRIHRHPGIAASLVWGDTSASPASQRAAADGRALATGRLLANLAEVLELPGEPGDYHFAIQGAAGTVRSRAFRAAALFGELERLCLLDLQLIQAVPEAVYLDRPGDQRYFHILTIEWLLQMYLREGLLADAVRVAEIAERFRQDGCVKLVDSARTRFAALTSEDAAL